MSTETPTNSAMMTDRGLPIGNYATIDGRRALAIQPMGDLTQGINYDTVKIYYTDSTKENLLKVEYFVGGVSGTKVLTINADIASTSETYERQVP